MPLPAHFQFSQGSLQDFADCSKRFYLRYIQHLAWPAVEAEPVLENERLMQQGGRFHTLVYQSLLGIPGEHLERMIQDVDLSLWWRNIQLALPDLRSRSAALRPEVNLSATLAGFTLVARCDLVAAGKDGSLQIFDWKTSQKRTRRERLLSRLQTRVYPYLLVRDGARFNGGQPVQPEQVEMIYWFPGFPDQPERFSYSTARFQADGEYLESLIGRIAGLEDREFVPGPQTGQSRYCVYRSFCGQGVKAGELSEQDGAETDESGLSLDFDFEQIAEVGF